MIGTILGSRYEIIEKIGEGGMAEVYKAKCHLLDRFVAIKILKKQFANDKDFVKKFQKEASSAAGLLGTNIVNIYDVGNENNINYIVMELVEGKTLKEIINENGPLPIEKVIDYSIQIAKALECAHKNNIIHRDVKPHNILVTDEENIKVTDFGIAKASGSATITNTCKVMGSAHYFSPEQAKGSYVDCRTDIYSLGIVIYEMVTGRVPFDAESPVSVALKHIQEPVIPPRLVNPNVPSNLNNLILKCIEKEPIKRYQSISELLNDINMIKRNNSYDIITKDIDDGNTKIMDPVIVDDKKNANKRSRSIKKNKNKNNKSKSRIFVAVLALLAIGILSGWGYGKIMSRMNAIKEVLVPDVVGLRKEEAKIKIENSGLNFILGESETSDEPKDKVLRTFPNSGSKVKVHSDVTVCVSKGPEKVLVRDFREYDYITAKNIIKNDNLRVEISYEFSDVISKGRIITQTPEPGVKVNKNDKIVLVVSNGPKVKIVTVPDLNGLTLNEAKTLLKLKKLNLGNSVKTLIDKKELNGKIYSQSIEKNDEVKEGSKIDVSYYVYDSKEVQRVKVPNFEGMTVLKAKELANSKGININVYGKDNDIVVSQDKEAGSEIYLGDIVNLSID
ncbi:serine/threonine-protein kinase PrkC [Clostridium tepidiprofundi DSM 19306]|uniref:non-specific serine/threonine protein kinase n=1 Tax=Clostridium tepidiprofundi DSM 19306 TaxID=1121338 RepID=A0A151B845_9CLOT|nr:Stk1 family PASTA domain-containing Ser/Thr kinase [Clostridium tepidiprofundi]KYH35912.1 serine/threonine-protein kinase PrkC [Clostridium tepidiprofundi DSM 19306]